MSSPLDSLLGRAIDAKLEAHRKRLAKSREWLKTQTQQLSPKSSPPKDGEGGASASSSSAASWGKVDLNSQRRVRNIDDGESVEAIINKLKLNASSIYDSSDDDDDNFKNFKGGNSTSNTSRSNNSNLTISSSNTPRQPPIEHKLLEEGKMMEERKEQLRDKHYSEITFRPNISEESRRLVNKGDQNNSSFVERFEEQERLRRDTLDTIRSELNEEPSFKPSISKMGQEMKGREDVSQVNRSWLSERDEKLNKLRELKEEQEMEEEIFKPKLNPRTLKIIERKKASLRENLSLEEAFERKEFLRQQRVQEMAEEQFGTMVPGTPKITAQAAKMIRDGSVSDRLYQLSFKMSEKKQEMSLQHLEDEKKMFDFNPKINWNEFEREEPVYDDLYHQEENSRIKRVERMEKLLEKENLLHHPRINPVSEEIASRLPHSSKERLLSSGSKTPKGSPIKMELTFKPRINEKSKLIESDKSQSVEERITQLLNFDKKKKQSLEEKRKEKDEKEMEQCTFKPNVLANPKTHSLQKTFADRLIFWDKKRKAKLEQERKEKTLQELKQCTFKPTIDRIKQDDLTKLENDSEPLGFDDFIQRQIEAREKKKHASRVINYGENWKHETTVPKEFTFGQKTAVIKSLRKPLTPQTSKIMEPEDMDKSFELQYREVYHVVDEARRDSESMEVFPPQGLFSTKSTLSILEGTAGSSSPPSSLNSSSNPLLSQLNYLASPHSTEKDLSLSDLKDYPSPTNEWMKRSKQKL
ncbi:hypothetical protein C9374_005952 [Naegleria lovaniensis]|uniref:Uncharacterized protein n=1 Tax=Naegleria lovaniensis TaxID=51637 RepID=A0AA88GP23_NAELO|nr:uncharacterized protein C9374_005952 [Naegleria lovaniensis]KAG2381568.1 hypothetical protein C9374_005952 [Naegleria lovaniensis]